MTMQNQPATPTAQSRAEIIKGLSRRANAVAAMLDVLDILPEYDFEHTLIACQNMAEDVNTGIYKLSQQLATEIAEKEVHHG